MSKHKFYIIIPLRRGSKRIKNKNTILIKNKMLFEYTLDKIIINKFFYKTFINSNDKTIKNWALKNKISFLDRSKKNQGDKSTTESVILETINKKKDEILFDKNSHIILLQCTSPLRNKNDLENCIKHYINGKFDSLFSGFVSKNLFWGKNKKKLTPVNYNLFNRKREQEMNEQIIENGSIYIFNLLKFLKYKNRLFENIGVYLMNKINSMQVDEKEDLEILEKFI
jgi:CMP-N,N'-diacetyllegionaminic acid synthase